MEAEVTPMPEQNAIAHPNPLCCVTLCKEFGLQYTDTSSLLGQPRQQGLLLTMINREESSDFQAWKLVS